VFKGVGASAILYLGLTFVSGTAVGGFGVWLYQARSVQATPPSPRTSGDFRKSYVEELRQRVNLTKDQVERLEGVLDSTQVVLRELRAKHMPEFEAIQQHQVNQIREMLDAKQKAEYERFRAERDARRKQGRNKSTTPPESTR